MAGNDGASAAMAAAPSGGVGGDVSVHDSAEQGGAVTYPSSKEQIYGLNNFKHGTFLSKGEGQRSEKYKRWIEEKRKAEAQQLDKKQHSCIVKLNSQSLEVRNELRELQSQRKPRKHSRHGSTGAPVGGASDTEPADCYGHRRVSNTTSSPAFSSSSSSASPNSLAPPSMNRGMRKSSSSSSLGSSSTSGFSSLVSSPVSMGKRLSGTEHDRMGGGTGKGVSGAAVRKGLNTGTSALKLKNLHSARALSKLNNDMDITY